MRILMLSALLFLGMNVSTVLAESPAGREYQIQANDSLSEIATREYGFRRAVIGIIAATNARAAEDDRFTIIEDPNALIPGQMLWLPEDPRGFSWSEYLPNLTDVDCPLVGRLQSGASRITCHKITVPENWDYPAAGRSLELLYTVIHSSSPRAQPDPIIYLYGGPGGNSQLITPGVAHTFADLLATRDVVILAQRGTAFASDIDCNTFQATLLFNGIPSPTAEEQELDTVEEHLEHSRFSKGVEGWQACYNHQLGSDVDLTQFNTKNSAHDLAALMENLDYERYNLYGVSYGTRLALTLMRDHPDSGLRGVVLDSVIPPLADSITESTGFDAAVAEQFFADCEADSACRETYPNLRQSFIGLLATAAEAPLKVEAAGQTIEIDTPALVDLLSGLGQRQRIRQVPYLPLLITELAAGRADTYLSLQSGGDLAASNREDNPEQFFPSYLINFTFETDPAADDLVERWVVAALRSTDNLPDDFRLLGQSLLSALPRANPSLDSVWNYIKVGQFGLASVELLEITQELNESDVPVLYERLGTRMPPFTAFASSSTGMHHAFRCQEDVAFTDLESAFAYYQAISIPELAQDFSIVTDYFAVCEVFESGTSPASEAEAIVSDVPTLILTGHYDGQTPFAWGGLAAETLDNSQLILLPMTGHGATEFSTCAVDLMTRFIEDPGADLDARCVDELNPVFVLPAE